MKEYIDRVKEGQDDMYHNTGDSIAVVSSSPFLENLRKLMMEVLGDKVEKVECIVQEIVEIFVSRMMEENVEAVKHVLQEQVQRITVEQIVDVPVLQIRKETDEVNQLLIQERISDHVDEHNFHIPNTQFQEQAIQAVRIISQERTWINRAASAVGIKPTDALWHSEHVVDVREEINLHLDSYQRDATDGMRSRWKHPADVAPISLQHGSSV